MGVFLIQFPRAWNRSGGGDLLDEMKSSLNTLTNNAD